MNNFEDIATTARVINAGLPENHTGCPQCKAHITAFPKEAPQGMGWVVLVDVAHTDEHCPTMVDARGELRRVRPWNLDTIWVRHRQHWNSLRVVNRVRDALRNNLRDIEPDMPVELSASAVERLRGDLIEVAVLADEELKLSALEGAPF